MMTCQHCSRPANVKRVERDNNGKPQDIYLCDKHDQQKEKRP